MVRSGFSLPRGTRAVLSVAPRGPGAAGKVPRRPGSLPSQGPMSSLIDRAVSHYGLTVRQAEVAAAYCRDGNLSRACRAVGYDYREAKRLLNGDASFQAVVAEFAQGMYLAARIEALRTVKKLMRSAESERVKLDAAKWIDERGGGKEPDRHIHEHHVTLDRGAIRAEIQRLTRELQLDQEIEVREITDEPPALPEGATDAAAVCHNTGRARAPSEVPAADPGNEPPPMPPGDSQ